MIITGSACYLIIGKLLITLLNDKLNLTYWFELWFCTFVFPFVLFFIFSNYCSKIMMKPFEWKKWELIEENVPQIKDVYSSPILGSFLISRNRVLVNIYKRENKRTGKVKFKKVEK